MHRAQCVGFGVEGKTLLLLQLRQKSLKLLGRLNQAIIAIGAGLRRLELR